MENIDNLSTDIALQQVLCIYSRFEIIFDLPLALLVLLRLAVELSLQRRRISAWCESLSTYTNGIAVLVQGEVLCQCVWNGLLILLRGSVHRNV